MNARGTRRPHARRPRKQPRKSSGGGPGKGAGCSFSLPSLPAAFARAVVVAWQIRGARS